MATKKRAAKKSAKKSTKHREQAQDTSKVPIGSPLSAPDETHRQNVEQLPELVKSVISDLLNNKDRPVSDLLPAVTERLGVIQMTVQRMLQGAHTAAPVPASVPNQPIPAHSSPTQNDIAIGPPKQQRHAAARAAQGANLNNPPGVAPHGAPAQTPPAEEEPGRTVRSD